MVRQSQAREGAENTVTPTHEGHLEAAPLSAETPPCFGRYALRGELGRGGMGVVYLAFDPALGREVALKLLLGGQLATSTARKRFLREAQAAARLRHPGLVEVYDLGEHNGQVFFTMRRVVGPSLARRLKLGPLPAAEAAQIAATLARALEHAHEQGLVHRDVKPANILLEDGAHPVLTDFGLVKESAENASVLTLDAQVLGTPGYMAPEQCDGETTKIGPASDQYALGVVLYEMLSGKQPFLGSTPMETLRRVMEGKPPPLVGVPVDLCCIVSRAIHVDPARRYASALAMAEDLERWMRGEPALAGRDAPAERLRDALTQHRGLTLSLGLALTLAGAPWALTQLNEVRAERQRAVDAETRRVEMERRVEELLESGQERSANNLFVEYVNQKDNAETDALARAWLDQGARMLAREELAEAEEANARAFALGTRSDDQLQALLGLARVHRIRHAWGRLARVLDTLADRAPEALALPEVQGWRRDVAFDAHDFQAARLATDSAEDRAFIDALSQVTRTEVFADEGTPMGGRAPTALAFAHQDRGELRLYAPEPSLSTLIPTPPLPFAAPWQTLDGPGSPTDPTALLVSGHGAYDLFRLRDGAWSKDAEAESTLVRNVLRADMDADGEDEIYVAGYRYLDRISPSSGQVKITKDRALNAAESEVRGMLVTDLDGDGAPEFTLGTSGWRAWDVRVLESDGAGSYELQARRQLGLVSGIVPIVGAAGPRIAALQGQDPAQPLSRKVFPARGPYAEARGVHILAGPRLDPVDVVRLPPLEGRSPDGMDVDEIWYHLLLAGDFDGDGDTDLTVNARAAATLLLMQQADGSFTAFPLGGLLPLFVVNLDDDSADELVMRDDEDRVWVVGAGQDTLPIDREEVPVSGEVPGAVPRADRARWRRAEDLVSLGLPEAAAARFDALALLSVDPEAAVLAQLRAAEVLESVGAMGGAVRRYNEAAKDPRFAARALEGAARCYAADRRFVEALAALQARLALGEVSESLREQAAELMANQPLNPSTLSFANGPAPQMQVVDPLDVGWDPALGGLRMRAEGTNALLQLLVRPIGGPVRIAINTTVRRLDWGAVVSLTARDQRGGRIPELGLYVMRTGGGGVLHTWAQCSTNIDRADLEALTSLDAPLTLSFEHSPGTGGSSCTIEAGGDELWRRVVPPPHGADALPKDPFWIVLGSTSGVPGLADSVLHELSLAGLEILTPPPNTVYEANALLVRGRAEEALRLLDRAGASASLTRALALDELGRPDEAARLVIAAMRAGELDESTLRRLLLLRQDRFGVPLRKLLGIGFFSLFWRSHDALLSMHADEDRVTEVVTSAALDGLEELRPEEVTRPDDAVATLSLMVSRGRAWLVRGRLGSAERAFDQAVSFGEALLARSVGEARLEVAEQLTLAEQGRAGLALQQGDPVRALEALDRALRISPAPELLADRLQVLPDLAPLQGTEAWERVVTARQMR